MSLISLVLLWYIADKAIKYALNDLACTVKMTLAKNISCYSTLNLEVLCLRKSEG